MFMVYPCFAGRERWVARFLIHQRRARGTTHFRSFSLAKGSMELT